MKNLIFILMLLTGFLSAQRSGAAPLIYYPFTAGLDTVGSISDVDTLEWQGGIAGLNATAAWNQLSTYITAANKTGEQTVVIPLSGETNWSWFGQIRIRVVSPSGTITSGWMDISNRLGAFTLFVQPDTTGTPQDTTLYKIRLAGQ